MASSPDVDQIEAAARERLNQRVEVVRRLAETRGRTLAGREQLAELERADAAVHGEAIQAGWTADELKDLGLGSLAAPSRRTQRQSRPRAAAAASAADA